MDFGVIEVAFDWREDFVGKVCSAIVGRFAGGAGCFGHGGRLVAEIRVGRVESEDNTISCVTTVQAGMTKISL